MSPRVALLVLPVVAFVATHLPGAAAQGTNAVCNSGYDWMTNSKNQSPCLVSSYLFLPCSDPTDSWVYPLDPGYHYNTPTADPTSATPCRCNTVLFSTISACATCQGQEDYIYPWADYAQNCSQKWVSQYPEIIPEDTAVPSWAYIDVTVNGTFDPSAALTLAQKDQPDSTAPVPTSTTSSSASSTAASLTSAPSSTSSSNGAPESGNDTGSASSSKKSNTGAIVGGVVGGVVGLAAIGLAIFFFLRHRRNQIVGDAPTGPLDLTASGNYGQYPQYAQYTSEKPLDPTVQPLQPSPKLYDPNDPTTFPSANEYPGSTADVSAHSGTHPSYQATPSFQPSTHTTYKGAPEL